MKAPYRLPRYPAFSTGTGTSMSVISASSSACSRATSPSHASASLREADAYSGLFAFGASVRISYVTAGAFQRITNGHACTIAQPFSLSRQAFRSC